MDNQALTIIIDYKVYAYLFKPIIEKLIERDERVIVFCPSEIEDLVTLELAVSPNVHIKVIDKIKHKHKNRRRIHRGLQALFTRSNFSVLYCVLRNNAIQNIKGVKGLLHKIARFTPKVPDRQLNFFLHKVTGICFSNPFPTKKILVGSLTDSAELLCAKGQQVYTIMESWDHPFKKPNGYLSYCVYAWNQSLADDWKIYQHDSNCLPFYPLKLRFAIHNILGKKLWKNSHEKRQRPMCVYAVSSTIRSKNKLWHPLDKRIIADLIVATERANWDFFIKPHPNGQEGEFDQLINGKKHVKIGSYLNNYDKNFANYFLDDSYNMKRFEEIIEADLVINAFTTFGLDAAMAGMPVLQLDLRNTIGYEDSRQVFAHPHIEKYLIAGPDTFKVNGESLLHPITEYLKAPTGLAERFSENLRRWLIPDCTMDEALDKLVNHILIEK